MNAENKVSVNEDEVKFLKTLAKTLDHKVRMIWDPAPTRQSPAPTPTHVTFISQEQVFVDYVKFELDRYRNRINAVAKSLVAPAKSNKGTSEECGTQAR